MKAGIRSIGLLLGILLWIVVFAPVPGHSRFVSILHNAAHGPIFGAVALLLLLGLRSLNLPANAPVSRQYAIAFVLAIGAGLATEVAQALTNRDSSWLDLRNDAIGALAFLLLFFPFDPRIRSRFGPGTTTTGLLVGLALFAFLLVPVGRSALEYRQRQRMFPILVDFTRGYDRYFVRQQHAVIGPAAMPKRWMKFSGETAMQVRLLQSGQYPGIELIEPSPDWTAYSTLLLDLTNPGPTDLALTLRIHDVAHTQAFTDRFNGPLLLRAGARELLRVSLADVRLAPEDREMRLEAIDGMVLFAAEPIQAEFLVSRVWLQ
jgi:hypothetical protein